MAKTYEYLTTRIISSLKLPNTPQWDRGVDINPLGIMVVGIWYPISPASNTKLSHFETLVDVSL